MKIKKTGFCSKKAIQNRIKENNTVSKSKYVSRSGKTTMDKVRSEKALVFELYGKS